MLNKFGHTTNVNLAIFIRSSDPTSINVKGQYYKLEERIMIKEPMGTFITAMDFLVFNFPSMKTIEVYKGWIN
jgi:hypothetical protein